MKCEIIVSQKKTWIHPRIHHWKGNYSEWSLQYTSWKILWPHSRVPNEQFEKHVILAHQISGIVLMFIWIAVPQWGRMYNSFIWLDICNCKWIYFRVSYRLLIGLVSWNQDSPKMVSSERCMDKKSVLSRPPQPPNEETVKNQFLQDHQTHPKQDF